MPHTTIEPAKTHEVLDRTTRTQRAHNQARTELGKHEVSRPASDFVSHYAQKDPAEDFAETFMFYLRSRGALPRQHNSIVLRRKWKFIAKLCSVISSGANRWPS